MLNACGCKLFLYNLICILKGFLPRNTKHQGVILENLEAGIDFLGNLNQLVASVFKSDFVHSKTNMNRVELYIIIIAYFRYIK